MLSGLKVAQGCVGEKGWMEKKKKARGDQWSMLLVGMRPVWIVHSVHEASVDSIQCAIRPA